MCNGTNSLQKNLLISEKNTKAGQYNINKVKDQIDLPINEKVYLSLCFRRTGF